MRLIHLVRDTLFWFEIDSSRPGLNGGVLVLPPWAVRPLAVQPNGPASAAQQDGVHSILAGTSASEGGSTVYSTVGSGLAEQVVASDSAGVRSGQGKMSPGQGEEEVTRGGVVSEADMELRAKAWALRPRRGVAAVAQLPVAQPGQGPRVVAEPW